MLYRIRLLVAFFVVLSGGAWAEQQARGIPIQPNQEVQSFLHALSSTNAQERQNIFHAGTQEEFSQKLAELRDKAGGTQKFVLQLLYFSEHARSTRQGMLPLVLVEQMNISASDRVAAIVPLLETDDQSVLKIAYEWLEVIDFDGNAQQFKFNRYRDAIRDSGTNVPQGLVKYMYTKSPDAALSSLATVYLDRDEAKSLIDQVRGEDDARAVDRLSQRREWWAHLYVVAMMEKNPSLRTPELLRKLEQDPDPLVREKMSKLRDKLQPR
ncbi:MAG: hypothetical protein QME60_04745 [Verrucomicrobiota bacterium]|nr:hypothetical protein [Verrucomicrobiota bacterium]